MREGKVIPSVLQKCEQNVAQTPADKMLITYQVFIQKPVLIPYLKKKCLKLNKSHLLKDNKLNIKVKAYVIIQICNFRDNSNQCFPKLSAQVKRPWGQASRSQTLQPPACCGVPQVTEQSSFFQIRRKHSHSGKLSLLPPIEGFNHFVKTHNQTTSAKPLVLESRLKRQMVDLPSNITSTEPTVKL